MKASGEKQTVSSTRRVPPLDTMMPSADMDIARVVCYQGSV